MTTKNKFLLLVSWIEIFLNWFNYLIHNFRFKFIAVKIIIISWIGTEILSYYRLFSKFIWLNWSYSEHLSLWINFISEDFNEDEDKIDDDIDGNFKDDLWAFS